MVVSEGGLILRIRAASSQSVLGEPGIGKLAVAVWLCDLMPLSSAKSCDGLQVYEFRCKWRQLFVYQQQRGSPSDSVLWEAESHVSGFESPGDPTSAPSLSSSGNCRGDGLQFMYIVARPRTAIAAEVLFVRKQLAYYQDHQIRPRPLTDAARLSRGLWSRLFDWKEALAIVTPATFVRWHRKSFKLYWRWKSRGGRPRLPREIRQLIARLVRENVTWGEERIADELSLKLGICVSPRTVRNYWPKQPEGAGVSEPRRSTGERSSGIMPRESSPATSWLR